MVYKYLVPAFIVIVSGVMPSSAEEKATPSNPSTDQATPVIAPTAPPTGPSVATPEVKHEAEIKPQKSIEDLKEKPRAKASEKDISKYKVKLGSLIAAQARRLGSIGNGYAVASFHINENGDIGSITIKSSSSTRHADAAKRIISSIHAGPPPGGSMSLNQKFQFK